MKEKGWDFEEDDENRKRERQYDMKKQIPVHRKNLQQHSVKNWFRSNQVQELVCSRRFLRSFELEISEIPSVLRLRLLNNSWLWVWISIHRFWNIGLIALSWVSFAVCGGAEHCQNGRA